MTKTNFVGCLTGSNYDLFHPQLTGSLDDVVSGSDVPFKALIVGNKHVPRICCEVYDRVWRSRYVWSFISGKVEVGR